MRLFSRMQDNPYRLSQSFGVNTTKIIDRLWIGNIYDSLNEELLNKLGINAVINLLGTGRVFPKIVYTIIPLSQPFGTTLPDAEEAVKKIDELRNGAGLNVMVHCWEGVDRSPTVVWKYLTYWYGLDEKEAVDLIMSQRPIAKPHPSWFKEEVPDAPPAAPAPV